MSSGQQNGYSPPHNNIQFHEELKLKKLQNIKASVSNWQNILKLFNIELFNI